MTTFAYDDFGAVTNETVVGVAGTNTIERFYDSFGRSLGYALNGVRQSTFAYDLATGRLASMLANGSDTPFTWNYLVGSDLKSSLAYPNGMTASWQYDANGRLLQVKNALPTNTISQYDYVYDAGGRRVNMSKSGSAFGQGDTISYGYNEKSELTNAVASVDSDYRYSYDFDEIGNRETSSERGTNCTYVANDLNQYTSISNSAPSAGEIFLPQFDDDGNQTLIKTAMGIWQVQYNGENRPILWECVTSDSNTPNSSTPSLLSMSFDRMGRRVTKNDQWFVCNGYLQIANSELQTSNIKIQTFIWDPTEPNATRPIVWNYSTIQPFNFSTSYYTHDGNKNVSEVVTANDGIGAHYAYAPFGAVTAATTNTTFTAFNAAATNHYRFSSEFTDDELGLVCYSYRHYNPTDGRWMNYDRHDPFAGYVFVTNDGIGQTDYLGLEPSPSALAPSQRGRDCIYRVYVADGISDPDLSLWDSYRLQKFPKYPNGDRYGYWGCGANVINEMTGNEHPGFELPVVFPKGERVNEDIQTDLGNRGMKPNYAKKFETISGSPNPFLVKTIERLKRFAKEDSGDMDCRCKSITIKIDCSNTLRNAEVFELLSEKERYKVFKEVESRKVYDNPSLYKIAHELYSAMYKEKLKCGTKTIVE